MGTASAPHAFARGGEAKLEAANKNVYGTSAGTIELAGMKRDPDTVTATATATATAMETVTVSDTDTDTVPTKALPI